MKLNLAGRVAAITGAGSGIGSAVAGMLAEEGMDLVLLGGRHAEKLEAAAQVLRQKTRCLVLPGDLTDTAAYGPWMAEIRKTFGRLDVLINNAGMAVNAPFETVTEALFDQIFRINVRTPYFLTQAALPDLRQSDCAAIVNICSVVSHAGYPLQSPYVASKHALLGFTKSLAREVYQDGIRVHAICPGGVYTDMVKISRPDLTGEGMIQPEEIADIVQFLLTHRGNAVIDEIGVHRVNKEPFL